ncbi:putative hydrolase [Caenibius tardaugens NBRC 16725]|uniref:Putative hydrolase n=1 Tax=Caenibius tardaugens NBRC 16725 TaxID=1219035 RepID=U2YJC6_9SPHN|nr:alpha/beta fold hydrolase [Caenibius tardaugens]AZI34763.1 alpha/beta fold hydrolase [Caenibius tardaugens NBRC 16725]GAD48282.1 putative hydrolase [Caenibius tardaugens NBRC 16725]
MSELTQDYAVARDGTQLALHRIGAGRPLVLLHGLFSNADTNWIRFGHARVLADAGFDVIMPDLRAHGQSGAPHGAAAYPRDVLVRDVEDVIAHCALADFDLAGFSLGARTAAAAVIAGVAPRRLVLAGMGLQGLSGWHRRAAFFIDAIDRFDSVKRGDDAWFAVQFMKSTKVDRVAARLLLQSVGDVAQGDLARITVPTLVVAGDKDRDNGDPEALAEVLPDARFVEISGTHMSSVTDPALGRTIAEFLTA